MDSETEFVLAVYGLMDLFGYDCPTASDRVYFDELDQHEVQALNEYYERR